MLLLGWRSRGGEFLHVGCQAGGRRVGAKAPAEDAVEEGPQRRHAGAQGGDGELEAGPDGEVDISP